MSGLTARAGTFRLGPVDVEVPAGRVLVVLGPSGAGKSTLLDVLAGFRAAGSGRIGLAGRELTHVAPQSRGIGVVFQDAALFPHLSVRENVAFGPRMRGARRERGPGRVTELLDRLGLAALADRRPATLSGGQRRRVALARALAAEPRALLLDEPLSALDQPTREHLRGVLHDEFRALTVPVVHVTHDRDEALTLADDLAVLVDGSLVQHGGPAELVGSPATPDVARLLGWSSLGIGRVEDDGRGTRVAVGGMRLALEDLPRGARRVEIAYRPEDVRLGVAGASVLPVRRVDPTVPLSRVVLGPDHAVTALVSPHELARAGVRAGAVVGFDIPARALRAWPAVTD